MREATLNVVTYEWRECVIKFGFQKQNAEILRTVLY